MTAEVTTSSELVTKRSQKIACSEATLIKLPVNGLPSGWKEVPLPEVLFFQEGPGLRSFQFHERGIPFLNIRTFQNGRINRSLCQFLDPKEVEKKYQHFLLNDQDIVCSTSGTIGKIATIFEDDLPLMLNTSVVRFRPLNDRQLDRGWIRLFLQTQYFLKQARGAATGSAQVNFGPSHIRKMSFILPPLPEQRRIVAEIEKQFTRLEAGVAALKRVAANLKRYRAAVLKAACEGRLVPTEAELAKEKGHKLNEEETGAGLLKRILEERRESWDGRGKYKEPTSPDFRNLPTLPDGWAWGTVDQLAAAETNSITDGPFGSNLKTEHYTESGPRVIRLQNIGEGVFVDEQAHIAEAHFARLQKHRVYANDILIAGLGEKLPRCCIVPESLGLAIVKADCIRFKPHKHALSKFLNAALNSESVRQRTKDIVHGVGRPRLNLGEIKSISIPLPPLAEQTRISAEVERRLSVAEELETAVAANLQRATCLRQSILQKAFTGQFSLSEVP